MSGPTRAAVSFGRAVVASVAVLLAVALLTYLVFFLLPSDPAQLSCGKPCTPENLARAQEFMGLNKGWFTQFTDFVTGVVSGRTFGTGGNRIHCPAPCLGYSFQQNETVLRLITDRMPVTLSITVGAAVLWMVFGIGAGLVAGVRPGSVTDRVVIAVTAVGSSTPVYLTGLLAVYVFGFQLNMIPVSGYVPFTDDPVQWAWHLVTPWLVLACSGACLYARLMRSNIIDAYAQNYIRTAQANGLPARRVLRHAARNGAVPVVTLFAIEVSLLLGGAVITETVFGMAGLGRLLIDAVAKVDLPIVVGLTVFSAFLVLVANLAVDAVTRLLDPRVGDAQ
ncbi:ABC transporter permease [Williamsia sp. CHRR-6]|uniref:ABC transporter permease n=1 Tax=Williamsia sp. CHRR-6 TaxID=2835871 RepID=UPI001BDB51F6|nr:ABC transporter permease [Williamsia sp. CHRR-6]MBT0565865.1 ABC transporter permease [Williamsia sp. CHRR-6]